MKKVTVVKHPLIQDKLTMMRDIKTQSKDFRALLKELATLMVFEVTRNLKVKNVNVKTPLNIKAKGVKIDQSGIVLVPILRAGIGMVDGVLDVLPRARVGHIGMYREPDTLEAVEYYHKLPESIGQSRLVLLIDPMLATGHTMVETLDTCQREGAKNMKVMCLVASPEGIEEVRKHHPRVEIFTAAVDERLDEHGYILPGLGDAGDRIFGTK